jgi:hypothetical protein
MTKLEELARELLDEIEKLKTEDVAYDERRPLDKQLVWCWDNTDKCQRVLRFYDAKNRRAYSYNGERSGVAWDNYKPYEGEYPDWVKEAYKILED